MLTGRALHEYKKNAIQGASPLKLVIMLYDGALKFIEAGRVAMLAHDIDRQNTSIQRAQKIIIELITTLDEEKGGEIALNLRAIYAFVLNELIDANIHDKPEKLAAATLTLGTLRESWAALEQQQHSLKEDPILAA